MSEWMKGQLEPTRSPCSVVQCLPLDHNWFFGPSNYLWALPRLAFMCDSIRGILECMELEHLITMKHRLLLLAHTKLYHTKSAYLEFLWSFEFWLAATLGLFFQKIHLFTPIHIQSWPKIKIRSSLGQFKHCSGITHLAIGSHIWSLFAPIHMKVDKSEIRSSSSRFEHCSESLI